MAARRKRIAASSASDRVRIDLPTRPWYDLPESERGGEVERLVRDYRTQQAPRRTRYIRNLELYEGRSMSGYSGYSYCEDLPSTYDRERLRLIRSAVSSAVANIYAQQKPKAQFQTLGASWKQRRKAYKLDRICEGILNQRQGRWINVWALMIDAGVEAALQGVAAIMVTANLAQKRIDHDLVPLPDIFTDPAQGRTPIDFFCRRPIAEPDALSRYAGRSEVIRKAIQGAKPYEWYGADRSARPRTVPVVEIDFAWHLPTSKDEPGHWCAQIGGQVVDSGEWTAPAPPFVFLMWEPWRDGFWASGIGDEGGAMSERIDDFDERLFIREKIASGLKRYYQEGSLTPDDLAGNDAVTNVAVQPGMQYPQTETPMAFHPMELEYEKFLVQCFWDGLGLSQVSAAARREQGVSSGVAIQTLNDTKSGRQLVKGQRYEQSFVDLAGQHVWRMRELAKEYPGFEARFAGKSLIRGYKFDEIDVEDDDFSVTVTPASALPHDPAGRLDYVQSMFSAGLISQETTKQLMNWPDLEAEMSIENAETEYLDMLIERYLDADEETWSAGEYQPPEAFIINKVGAVRRFASAWFRARIDQAVLPEDERIKAEFNIQLIARFIKELDILMQPPAPPPGAEVPPAGPMAALPPPAAVPGMLPPGGPGGAPSPQMLPPPLPVGPPQPGI